MAYTKKEKQQQQRSLAGTCFSEKDVRAVRAEETDLTSSLIPFFFSSVSVLGTWELARRRSRFLHFVSMRLTL